MKPVKVGFVLASNLYKSLASTRVFAWNLFPYLKAANYDPIVCFEPVVAQEYPDVPGLSERMHDLGIEVAIFQKVHGPSVLQEVGKLSEKGIKTIYGVCDFIDNEMVAATDATIVVTDYLKGLYAPQLHDRIHVVHDGIENPDLYKTDYCAVSRGTRSNPPLQAVLVTGDELLEIPVIETPPDFVEITVIGYYPAAGSVTQRLKHVYRNIRSSATFRQNSLVVRRLFGRGFKTVNWDMNTVHKLMRDADIGIIPIDMRPDPMPNQNASPWQVKSENRLTMKMAVGLPVIASPVPSYLPVVDQGRNGFIATTRDDWNACFEELRDSRTRQRIGQNARISVLHMFSKEAQARKLARVIEAVRNKASTPATTRR